MCCIVQIPKGASFEKGFVQSLQKRNSDGFGLMFAYRGRVVVRKIPTPIDGTECFDKLSQFSRDDREMFLHFRMRTHGDIDMINTHPYKILDKEIHGTDLYMMHNGVLNINTRLEKRSDTWHFANEWVKPLLENNPELLYNDVFQKIIEDVAISDKIVFLSGDGRVVSINKSLGKELSDNGCWVSNTNGLYPIKSVISGEEYYYGYHDWVDGTRGDRYNRPAPNNLFPISNNTKNKRDLILNKLTASSGTSSFSGLVSELELSDIIEEFWQYDYKEMAFLLTKGEAFIHRVFSRLYTTSFTSEQEDLINSAMLVDPNLIIYLVQVGMWSGGQADPQEVFNSYK